MKKIQFVIFCISILTAMNAPAFGWATGEGSAYSRGNMLGSAGVSVYHFGALTAFDYGLHDCISAGVAAGYTTYKFGTSTRTHQVPVMARVAFHPFNLKVLSDKIVLRDMLDVYAGISAGWIFRWYTTEQGIQKPDEGSSPRTREYIGMRYFFSDKLAVFVEDSGYLSYIGGGITYRF